jgi:hypothetical protein
MASCASAPRSSSVCPSSSRHARSQVARLAPGRRSRHHAALARSARTRAPGQVAASRPAQPVQVVPGRRPRRRGALAPRPHRATGPGHVDAPSSMRVVIASAPLVSVAAMDGFACGQCWRVRLSCMPRASRGGPPCGGVGVARAPAAVSPIAGARAHRPRGSHLIVGPAAAPRRARSQLAHQVAGHVRASRPARPAPDRRPCGSHLFVVLVGGARSLPGRTARPAPATSTRQARCAWSSLQHPWSLWPPWTVSPAGNAGGSDSRVCPAPVAAARRAGGWGSRAPAAAVASIAGARAHRPRGSHLIVGPAAAPRSLAARAARAPGGRRACRCVARGAPGGLPRSHRAWSPGPVVVSRCRPPGARSARSRTAPDGREIRASGCTLVARDHADKLPRAASA